ncbi:MAG TPA: DHHA1 domain-containing protein, partial [Patescibacteria group bacterium]|nr:DHHA1 domain-containing protein [Patescibacteria group bacterium]
GSARSYGDFSVADAIRASDDIITKGGGHKLAAGVTLPTQNIDAFRRRVNEYFVSLNLSPQIPLLLPSADVIVADFSEATEALITELSRLEPYGNGNPEPIICFERVTVVGVRRMGSESQHVKLSLQDINGKKLDVVAFSAPEEWFAEVGQQVSVWAELSINEWRGMRSVQGRLLHLVYTSES